MPYIDGRGELHSWIRREPTEGRSAFVRPIPKMRRHDGPSLFRDKLNIPCASRDAVMCATPQRRDAADGGDREEPSPTNPTSSSWTSRPPPLTERGGPAPSSQIIRDLKSQGKGIIYITHKMKRAVSRSPTEVSVFRDGPATIGTKLSSEVTPATTSFA